MRTALVTFRSFLSECRTPTSTNGQACYKPANEAKKAQQVESSPESELSVIKCRVNAKKLNSFYKFNRPKAMASLCSITIELHLNTESKLRFFISKVHRPPPPSPPSPPRPIKPCLKTASINLLVTVYSS